MSAVTAVDERQEIAGPPDVVGQHPAQQVGIDRCALLDQPFADIHIDVELEREDRVVVLGERLGEAFHEQAMEGGGLFLVGGHGRNGCGGRKSGLDGLVSSPKVKETPIKIHPRRSLQRRSLRARSADFRDP